MQQDESVVANRKNPPVQTAAPLNPHPTKLVACLVGSGCMFMLHGLLHICHFRTEPGRNRPMLYPNGNLSFHFLSLHSQSFLPLSAKTNRLLVMYPKGYVQAGLCLCSGPVKDLGLTT